MIPVLVVHGMALGYYVWLAFVGYHECICSPEESKHHPCSLRHILGLLCFSSIDDFLEDI